MLAGAGIAPRRPRGPGGAAGRAGGATGAWGILIASPEDLTSAPRVKKRSGRLYAARCSLALAHGQLFRPKDREFISKLCLEEAQATLARGTEALEASRHGEALELLGRLEGGPLFACPAVVVRMGQCYLAMGEIPRAIHVSTSLLRQDGLNVDAHLLRAEAHFEGIAENIDSARWTESAEAAAGSVRQALQLDPEHRAAAKLRRRIKGDIDLVSRVQTASARGRWPEVEELLTGVLESAQGAGGRFAARCHAQRGTARLHGQDFEGCVADCARAASLDNRLATAPVVHAQALQKLERWQEAVSVLEALHAWKKDEDVFWKVEWAKFEVRRVARPDYYAILGVPRTATAAEVKSAYRRRSWGGKAGGTGFGSVQLMLLSPPLPLALVQSCGCCYHH